jgi:hypothetical protein
VAGSPSASAQPEAQLRTQEVVAGSEFPVQDGVACCVPHTLQSEPQRATTLHWASHPVVGSPSASIQPAAQLRTQEVAAGWLLPEQVGLACTLLQTLQSEPQWAVVPHCISQPLMGSLSRLR